MPYSKTRHSAPGAGTARLRALLVAGLWLVSVPGLLAQEAPSAPAVIRGDVDGDGQVTRADADAVRAWLVRGATAAGRTMSPAADANGDGRITAADAALISRFAAGIDVSRFAVGRPMGAGGARGGGTALVSTEYECEVEFREGTLRCGVASPSGAGGARTDLLLYEAAAKAVNTGGGAYSGGDKTNPDTMTYNVAVKNLIPQPIGTTDGTTPDTSRLVITSYILQSPTPATAQLANADGTATFVDSASTSTPVTFANREYMNYPGLLVQNATSAPRFLQFVFSPSVTSMRFKYRIWTRVQYQYGYVTVSPASVPDLYLGNTTTLTGAVYGALGAPLGDTITWSSSDPAVATVNASTGVVTAVAVGTATITATSTAHAQRTGARSITVTNVNTWQGDVSSDWSTAGNWDASVVPDSVTVAVIPAAGSIPNMPVLTAHGSVLDLSVGTGSTVGLGGFTLRAYGDVSVSGTISNGTVSMRGATAQLGGAVPTVSVGGNISLQASTSASGPVTITNGPVSGASLTLDRTTPLTIINP
jgi:Bacterial Ig-like domain (group 2)/Dockerin type I domain